MVRPAVKMELLALFRVIDAVKIKNMLEELIAAINRLRIKEADCNIVSADPECIELRGHADASSLYRSYPGQLPCVPFLKKIVSSQGVVNQVVQ